MNANGRRSALTLIEVLIIVIIMALLATTIIPQFSTSTKEAKKSSLDFNLHTMRSLIEMYKVHHNSTPPSLANFADQMTKPTDVNGNTSGSNLIYGPYLQGKVPANPFNGKNTLVASSGAAGVAPSDSADSGASGWQYDASDGGFYPDHVGYDYANQQQP